MAFSPPILNLSAFTVAELQALLTAAKAELMIRLTGGRIASGAGTGSSYTMNMMSTDDLVRLIGAVTVELGLDDEMTFVRPNFSECGTTSNPYTGI